jgi:hypothetical protein
MLNLRHCRPLICLAKPINYACKLDPFNELGVAFAFPFLQFVRGWGTTLFSREKSHPFVGQVLKMSNFRVLSPLQGAVPHYRIALPLMDCVMNNIDDASGMNFFAAAGSKDAKVRIYHSLGSRLRWLLVFQQVFVAVR